MVVGATTYRTFAEFWPTPASEGEIIAPALNGLRRYVFSRQLQNAPWGGFPAATIESGDAVAAIRRIKSEVAGTIVLWGSLTLSLAFFAAVKWRPCASLSCRLRSARGAACSRLARTRPC